jgi:hypothetical protein
MKVQYSRDGEYTAKRLEKKSLSAGGNKGHDEPVELRRLKFRKKWLSFRTVKILRNQHSAVAEPLFEPLKSAESVGS